MINISRIKIYLGIILFCIFSVVMIANKSITEMKAICHDEIDLASCHS